MDEWSGWPFARAYLILVALAFVLVGAQVLLFHYRAAFHRWTMYIPVLGAPGLIVAGLAGAAKRDGIIGWIALTVFAIGVLDGLVGIVEHLRGIAARVGGFSLRNVISGPPPFLPVAFSALALTGALALAWGAF